MNAKHTPGKWKALKERALWWVRTEDGILSITSLIGRQEVEANAHLIAAAPDLLEACQRALAEAEDGLTIGCVEDLRDAVKKALGGE